ncbi:hypothetical protein SRABI06_03829 [Pseudomonas brassicacearum]|nr:hypothetical protein SRABI06_03829 [Pseudomonas brassicacearum]
MTSNAAANRAAGKPTRHLERSQLRTISFEMARNCDLFIGDVKPCGEGACSRWLRSSPKMYLSPQCIRQGVGACCAVQREQAPSPQKQKRGVATEATPLEENRLSVFDQTTLATTFGRGDNTLTSTKLTNATLRL